MRRTNRGLASRAAACALIAGLVAPALALAAEEEDADVSAEPPLVRDTNWYDGPLRGFEQTVDLLVVRPLAGLTLATGAVLFVPAAILSSPSGMEAITDAYERFVDEPGQYFWSRPLGEF